MNIFIFSLLILSVIAATSFIVFTFGKSYENKLHKLIFKRVLPITAIAYILVISGYFAATFTFGHLILFILICFGFIIFEIGILTILEDGFDESMILIFIFGLIFIVFSTLGLLTLNFETTSKDLPEQEIILSDYSPNEKNINEKITFIELTTSNSAVKSFAIQVYTPTEETNLPLKGDYIDIWHPVDVETNKIVISGYEKTCIDLLAYLGIREAEVYEYYTYTLYINPEDILYN